MAAELHRFMPRQEIADRDLAIMFEAWLARLPPGRIPDHDRDSMRNALFSIAHPNSEQPFWGRVYNMITREQTEAVWDAIRKLPSEWRPNEVRHAFDLVLLYLHPNTGEVALSRAAMAKKMETHPSNVSRAMSVLVRGEVVTRKRVPSEGKRGPGRVVYAINPYVAWNGRHEAWKVECAKTAPPSLNLVQPREVVE